MLEVVFKTSTELDVPLPSDVKADTGHGTLGAMDPQSQHMSGTGVTKGGVPEGVMPRSTPIENLEIRPVGNPRAGYPFTGKAYNPYPPVAPTVRNLQGPLGGVTGAYSGDYHREDANICTE